MVVPLISGTRITVLRVDRRSTRPETSSFDEICDRLCPSGHSAVLGVISLFESRPFNYVLVNGGYMVVAFVVMGAIIGGWR